MNTSYNYYACITYLLLIYLIFSTASNRSDNIIDLSDKLAITSSFILSFSFRVWFMSRNSSIFVSKSAPCLSNYGIFRKVKYVWFNFIKHFRLVISFFSINVTSITNNC